MCLAQDKTLLARERFTVKLRKPRTVEIFQRCSLCFAQQPVYGGPQHVARERVLLQLQAVDCSEFDRTRQNNLCVINE